MMSLRGQLTLWVIGLLTVVGILAGLATAYVSLREQNQLLDDQLRQIALSVGDTPSAAGNDSRAIAGVNPDDRIAVQILDRQGNIIRNSDPSASIDVMAQTGFSEHLDGDVVWRTFALITPQRIIQVSQDTDVRTDIVRAAALNTVLPIILLIPLSWLVVGVVVRGLLRPLNEFSQRLRGSSGSERVKLPVGVLPVELQPLASATNDLLDRQHELLEFRETFISDAAHQLRTPVAGLVLQLQNLKQELPLQPDKMFHPLEAGLARISTLLRQLLNLARAETPAAVQEEVRLGDAVRSALSGVVDLAESKSIDLGLSEEADARVRGNAVDVSMLIGNLLDNAVRYTPAGGVVDVKITTAPGSCSVLVTDTGPGIPAEQLPRVFDRFHRVPGTMSEGSGLGLSIVQALAQRLHATVRLRNRESGPGLEASVTFAR